jgi:hypothetical protein
MLVCRIFSGKDSAPGPALIFFKTLAVHTFPSLGSNFDAVCFLILILDLMSFVTDTIPDKGKDDILTNSGRPREGANLKGLSSSRVSWMSHSSLHVHSDPLDLKWMTHVHWHSDPLDFEWKNCAMNIHENVI